MNIVLIDLNSKIKELKNKQEKDRKIKFALRFDSMNNKIFFL